MLKRITSYLLLTLFAGCLYGQKFHNQKIVGYVPDYGDYRFIDYTKVTHAIFGFLKVNRDGTIAPITNYYTVPSRTAFLDATEAAGTKRLIAISGDSLKLVGQSDVSIDRLADTLVKYCKHYGFDGVDIDWEGIFSTEDSNNYRRLMISLRQSLKPEALDLVATVTYGNYWGPWISDVALQQADWIQVMVYDQTGTWAASPFGNHSTMQHLKDAEEYWVDRGFTRDKLVMGVPFYGYKFKSISGGLATAYSYKEIVGKFPYLCDDVNQTPGNDYNFFNGPKLIRDKCQYLIDNGFGGVMIWELTKDAVGKNSLLDQIACTYSDNTYYIKPCGNDDSDGTALYFMESNQKVNIDPAKTNVFHFQDEFTIEAKVKLNNQKGWSNIFSNSSFNANGYKGIWFGVTPNGGAFMQVHNGTTTAYYLSGTSYLVDDKWHHIAGVYKNDSIYLIVDGKEEGRFKVPAISYDQTPVILGNDIYGEVLSGAIDEMKVWNVARSVEDINANKDECLNGDEANLVALYHFDEGKNSTTLIDHTANGNNGTFSYIDPYAWVKGTNCTTSTSISQAANSISKFTLYPNPSSGKFALTLDRNYNEIFITIVDSYGQEVQSIHEENSKAIYFDLEVNKGLYFAIVTTDGKNETIKMVVE